MKPAHVLVAVIFGGLLPVGGQSLPPQKAPEILRTSTDTNLLRWHGHQGRSYFLQVSDPSKHLEKWLWMPVIIAGADAEISQEVQTTGNKGFYRICYTDQVPGAGETLETADFDQDGLSNINEIRPQNGLATHPLNPDTDADGLKDGWEVSHAFNPHDSSDAAGDKDGDGLTNLQEYQWGANPTNSDTDGDGALDGDEKNGNTNPKDPKSAPQEGWIVLTGDHAKEERKALKRTVTIPKGQTRLVMVVLHSEEYPEYTEYNSEFDDLLEWKITPTGGTEIAGQADVNDKHADWQLAESNGTAIKNFYPAHIEKVSSLTAPPEKDLIVTLELAATNISDDEKPSTVMVGLLPVEVGVDADRNGVVEFGVDLTSATTPYRFWINNDHDSEEDDEGSSGQPDHSDGGIVSRRDLEDFTRIQLMVGGLHEQLKSGEIQVTVKFKDGTVEGSPAINLTWHRDDDGDLDYIKDDDIALRHIMTGMLLGKVSPKSGYTFDRDFWTGDNTLNYGSISQDKPYRFLLFEGASKGKGELVLEFKKGNEVLAEACSCWVNLLDVRNMYQRVKVTPDDPDKFTEPSDFVGVPFNATITPHIPNIGWVWDPFGEIFIEDPEEEKEYIVFVHGWNMTYVGAQKYGESMFKRLWQTGYKGRYAFVRWPTYTGVTTYNSSDYRAWLSGKGVAAFVNSLPSDYVRNIAAHSMGNIVVGSALRENM